MQISKQIQADVADCDRDLLKDCDECKGCDEWNHFEFNTLVKHARNERIWYCPKCVMIGNYVEFHAAAEGLACNRCNSRVEEITLEQ